MKKGKVVEIKDKYAIVLNEDMVYEKIKKKDNLKTGKNIYYFEEDKYVVKSIPFKKYFLVAALFLILFIPPLMNIDNTFGYISIDINPSIQLEVDKNLKTLDIKSLNTDGKDIIKDEWIGKDAKVVIENIIKETEDKDILNQDRDFVLVSYYLTNKDKSSEEKLIKDFDEIFNQKQNNYEVAIVKSDNKSFEKSKEENTTIGRATLNEKIKETSKDLMEVKEEIKKDKDFKVYQKQRDKKSDKVDKENKEKIKGNKKREENIENKGNKGNKEKIEKNNNSNRNKEKLNNNKKDNKVNPKNEKNEKVKEDNSNKNKEKNDKLKENNSNQDKEKENQKNDKNEKIKEKKNKNIDKLRDKINNNPNKKDKNVKEKKDKSNNPNH